MREDLREFPRVVLYDTLWEDTYDSYGECAGFTGLCDLLLKNGAYFRVRYRDIRAGGFQADFERCCRAIECANSLVFAVEEIEQFSSPHYLPRELERIVALGRHRELSLFCTTRRPPSLHPLIRSQAHQVISFRQHEPRDVTWLREFCGEEASKQVTQLKNFKYIRWTGA